MIRPFALDISGFQVQNPELVRDGSAAIDFCFGLERFTMVYHTHMRTMFLEYAHRHLPEENYPVLQLNLPTPWSTWE
jgi:hypothetical protein